MRQLVACWYCCYVLFYPAHSLSITGSSESARVVAFWHIFTGGSSYADIVQQQATVINQSGLYDQLDQIYYARVGPADNLLQLNGSKYAMLKDHGQHGNEILTLKLLYDYCMHTPSSDKHKVLYFHNKGSFHTNPHNSNFRELLNCFVLNPHCITALDSHDTCGMRFSPMPYLHYSGNFWWANCKHIKRLIDPTATWQNASLVAYSFTSQDMPVPANLSAVTASDLPDDWCVGSGRYFAEYWMGSLPSYSPADCISLSMDSRYILGYHDMPAFLLPTFCPAFYSKKHYGADCGYSPLLANTTAFRHGLDLTLHRLKKGGGCKPLASNRKTEHIYGQPASLLESALSPVADDTLFRFGGGYPVVFWMKNGSFYALPNQKTIEALGMGSKPIIEAPYYIAYFVREGEPIPSI